MLEGSRALGVIVLVAMLACKATRSDSDAPAHTTVGEDTTSEGLDGDGDAGLSEPPP